MQISVNYIVVKKYNEPKQEGFQTVEATDNFIYKGVVTHIPGTPVYLSDRQIALGDIILFAKYSPDTIEIEIDNEKLKFVKITDILAVL